MHRSDENPGFLNFRANGGILKLAGNYFLFEKGSVFSMPIKKVFCFVEKIAFLTYL